MYQLLHWLHCIVLYCIVLVVFFCYTTNQWQKFRVTHLSSWQQNSVNSSSHCVVYYGFACVWQKKERTIVENKLIPNCYVHVYMHILQIMLRSFGKSLRANLLCLKD